MMIGLFNWASPSGCLGLPDQVTAVCMYVVLEMMEMRLDRAPTRRDEAGQMDVHKLARQASPLVLCRRSSLPCYPRPAATRRSTTLPCCAPAGPVRLLCWALPFAQVRGFPGRARCLRVDAGVELAFSSSWKGPSAISRLGGCPWSRAQLSAPSRRAPRLDPGWRLGKDAS